MASVARRSGGVLGEVCLVLLAVGVVLIVLQPDRAKVWLASLEGSGIARLWQAPLELLWQAPRELTLRGLSWKGWGTGEALEASRRPEPPGSGADGRHRVRRGDTLSEIAAAYGVDLAELAETNRLSRPDVLWVGQALVIPGRGLATGSVLPAVSAGPPPGEAQESVEDFLAQAEDALQQADFDTALEAAGTALQRVEAQGDPSQRDPVRVRVQVIRATAYTAFGRSSQARQSFAQALEADPELVLDPGRTSPKVLAAFYVACVSAPADRALACRSPRAPGGAGIP